jgi:hypothetical protein
MHLFSKSEREMKRKRNNIKIFKFLRTNKHKFTGKYEFKINTFSQFSYKSSTTSILHIFEFLGIAAAIVP